MKKSLLLFVLALLPLVASAVEFTDANGIIYELGGKGTSKVAKVKGTTPACRASKNMVIPSTVTYENSDYTVTTILSGSLGDDTNNSIAWDLVKIPATITTIEENACLYGSIDVLDVADLEAYCKIACTGDTHFAPQHFYVNGTEETDIVVPNTVNSISKYLFCAYRSLTSLSIPGSVQAIGEYAFYNCNITSLELSEGLRSIGQDAFAYCNGLTSVTIPASFDGSNYSTHCFEYCENLTSVVVKGYVTEWMFDHCDNLSSVTLEEGCPFIGLYAFQGCAISTITIPATVHGINSNAFGNCSQLKTVTFKHIDRNARGWNDLVLDPYSFGNCVLLEDVYCEAPISELQVLNGDPFEDSQVNEGATLHVPADDVDAYKSTFPWSQFSNVVALKDGKDDGDGDITYVDLGLPSGTKWATMNVGATSPEDPGDIFAWAETEAKTSFTESNYKYGTSLTDMTKYNSNDGLTELEASDDAATTKLGSDWRTPTVAEWRELRDKCTRSWMTVNGKTGYQFTGPNGNKIFLPCGFDNFWGNGAGYYWSSSLSPEYETAAWNVDYDNGGFYIDYNEPTGAGHRYTGRNIRAVYGKANVTPTTQKCATPTISYSGGKLRFACETPDVEFFYDISSADDKNGKGSEVDVTPVYHINVYASKDGYLDSDVASADINMACEDAQNGSLKGDLNGDNKVDAADHVELTKIIMGQEQ